MKKIRAGDLVLVKRENVKVKDFDTTKWYEIEEVVRIKGIRRRSYKLKDSKYSIWRKDIKERRRANETI